MAPVSGQVGECDSPDHCAHKGLLQAQTHVRAVESEMTNESLQDTSAMKSMMPLSETDSRMVAAKDSIQLIEHGLRANMEVLNEQRREGCEFDWSLCNWMNAHGDSGDWSISSPQPGMGPSTAAGGSTYVDIQSKQNKNVHSFLVAKFDLAQDMELQFKYNIQGVYPTTLMIIVQDSWQTKVEWIQAVNPGDPWADDVWQEGWLDLNYYRGYKVTVYISGNVTGLGRDGSGYVAIDSVNLVASTGRAPQPHTKLPTPLPDCGFEDPKVSLCGWFNQGWPHWLEIKPPSFNAWSYNGWPDNAPEGKTILGFASGRDSEREATLKSPELVILEPTYLQFKYNIVGGARPSSLKVAFNSKVVWQQVAGIKPCEGDNWKVGSVDLSEHAGTGEVVRITFVATVAQQSKYIEVYGGHVAIDALEFVVVTGTAPPAPQPTTPDMRSDCWCTGHLNEYKCADGAQGYCRCEQACVRNKCSPFKKGEMSKACWTVPGRRRRRCR